MMRRPRIQVPAGLLFILCACEHSAPVAVQPHPLPAPASSPLSLSPAAREQLRTRIDLSALDRLLITLGPEDRARFLRSFEDVEWAASGRRDVETTGLTVTVQFGDPERQQLLERVWAPFWSQLPPSVLSDASYPLPGRTIAAVRRADSASVVGSGRKP